MHSNLINSQVWVPINITQQNDRDFFVNLKKYPPAKIHTICTFYIQMAKMKVTANP